MNDNIETNRSPQSTTIDQEQIKKISELLRKYSDDLENVKSRADLIWADCEIYLDESVIKSIDNVKEINRRRYKNAMEELDNYTYRIDRIANIWNDAEEKIKVSSKELENAFSEIGKTITNFMNNNNNNS